MKEYLLTYLHTNGKLIGPKQLPHSDLGEVYSSPFVESVIALTEIDFSNYQECRAKHEEKVRRHVKEQNRNEKKEG